MGLFPNVCFSKNNITFADEELFECNALQNAEIRTVLVITLFLPSLSNLLILNILQLFARFSEKRIIFVNV